MTADPLERHFEHASSLFMDLLRRSRSRTYAGRVRDLRSDDGIPQLCVDLYQGPREPLGRIRILDHRQVTFVFDAPSDLGANGDDRVVAALASSQKRYSLTELAIALSDAEGPPASVLAAVRYTLGAHAEALSARKRRRLGETIERVLAVEGVAASLDSVLCATPSRTLLHRIRDDVLPLLEDFRPPRSRAAQRQYRRFDGMQGYDVGHFIAHAAGGHHDINTFPQSSALNRGQSSQGRWYREMERFVAANAGAFHCSRPVYLDESWVPHFLEFRVLIRQADALGLAGRIGSTPQVGDVWVTPAIRGLSWWVGAFENRTAKLKVESPSARASRRQRARSRID